MQTFSQMKNIKNMHSFVRPKRTIKVLNTDSEKTLFSASASTNLCWISNLVLIEPRLHRIVLNVSFGYLPTDREECMYGSVLKPLLNLLLLLVLMFSSLWSLYLELLPELCLPAPLLCSLLMSTLSPEKLLS